MNLTDRQQEILRTLREIAASPAFQPFGLTVPETIDELLELFYSGEGRRLLHTFWLQHPVFGSDAQRLLGDRSRIGSMLAGVSCLSGFGYYWNGNDEECKSFFGIIRVR